MTAGRPRGPRPTALPRQLADVAEAQSKYWTAVGTIGRALQHLAPTDQVRLLRVLLNELEPKRKRALPKTAGKR